MSRYLKHKKQEEEALKRKSRMLKEQKKKEKERQIFKEKMDTIWNMLKECFSDYEEVKSPYSSDLYLVKPEDKDLITFDGKPEGSLRYSNHWNWISDGNGMQCKCASNYFREKNDDMHRQYYEFNKMRRPSKMWQICIYIQGEYYIIAGEYLEYDGNRNKNIPKNYNKLINSVNNFLKLKAYKES